MSVATKLIIYYYSLVQLFSLTLSGATDYYNLFGVSGQGYVIEINLGHPTQKFNVILDTGSSTLAIASVAHPDITSYFHEKNSTTLQRINKEGKGVYAKAQWTAHLVSDLIQFPSLHLAPEVRSNIALITSTENFYINGSGWQGVLGIAYPILSPASLYTDDETCCWLQSVDKAVGHTMSFYLKLCGVRSMTDTSHYGSFQLIDSATLNKTSTIFRTPILRESWYQIGILSVRLINETNQSTRHRSRNFYGVLSKRNSTNDVMDKVIEQKNCRTLNALNSIVDSGSFSIIFNANIFQEVVNEIKKAASIYQLPIKEAFWENGSVECFPEHYSWPLPWLAVDLLSADDYTQYFSIEIPPESYVHLVSYENSTKHKQEYCYKLGLESGNTTILGVVGLEGLKVTFNRAEKYVAFETSDCGPDIRLSGPYNTSKYLPYYCNLASPYPNKSSEMLFFAEYTLLALLIVISVLLLYFTGPYLRSRFVSLQRASTQMLMSHSVYRAHN